MIGAILSKLLDIALAMVGGILLALPMFLALVLPMLTFREVYFWLTRRLQDDIWLTLFFIVYVIGIPVAVDCAYAAFGLSLW